MSGDLSGAEVHLYVISCGRERAKIGVAADARKRLRELQVGSPTELKLDLMRPFADRRDAEAVAEELSRCFGERCVRGSWYRVTAAEVREALARRATLEAPDRARAAAEAAARESPVAPRRVVRLRSRTEKQLAYERRRRQERTRKQKRAAKLLGRGMRQEQTAREVGVTSRTLRNWKAAPAFRRELERQHKRAARRPTSRTRATTRLPPAETQNTGATTGRAGRASSPTGPPTPPSQQQTLAEQAPAIEVEQAERDRPPVAAEEQADAADPPRSASTSQHDRLPIFPDTRDGRAARLAYYEARKLNNPPNSLLDYNDARRGLAPPAERRAREHRDNPTPR